MNNQNKRLFQYLLHYELRSFLRSFWQQIEVLVSGSLREEMAETAQKSFQHILRYKI